MRESAHAIGEMIGAWAQVLASGCMEAAVRQATARSGRNIAALIATQPANGLTRKRGGRTRGLTIGCHME
jgi:hypothetical protein